jgi:predicted ester cyclase
VDVSGTEQVAAIRAAVAAFNRGDVDGYLAAFDPAGPRWIVGVGVSLSLSDVDEGMRQLHAAFDPLRLDEDALFGAVGMVCARWRLHGMQVAPYLGVGSAGTAVSVEQCEVYRFEGDRVAEVWTYVDPNAIFDQLTTEAPGDGR